MAATKGSAKKDIQRHWPWFFALGLLMMIGGVSAFIAPLVASILVEVIVGIFFVIGGIVMLVQVFATDDGWDARFAYLILGCFNAIAGVLLLLRPLEGLLALTFVMIAAFFVAGWLRLIVGVQAQPDTGSGWVIFGGVVSVLMSIYLIMQYPEISVRLLGFVASVSLLGEGAGYLRFAYGLKNNVSVAI